MKEMPVSKEVSRLFQSAGKSVESSAQLRKLVGRCSGRPDISDGSQQDILEFHDLFMKVLRNELVVKDYNQGLTLINKFYGLEKNRKAFLHTIDGNCNEGHTPRTEEENFQVLKLAVPESNLDLSLNNMIANHYSETSNTMMMKCSDCCI